ncbi:hypothetical protein QBC46DRAFT_433617 [Diplogelasinospora grovesii]|uniref:Uncharacterized protein n=1 Tax=Diplogelasinospora grovesii TaxID=303347 RepID=A0AAN6NJT6_9PEZI|nr:hypothetical protein QBC46DRAFT_433617 [Diplogelasinospora grovesii]
MTYGELMADDFTPSYDAGNELLITKFSAAEDDDVESLRVFHEDPGFKWWFLCPEIQAHISDGRELDEETPVILKHTRIFVLNRGMNTKLTLPDGQHVYPQENIPPMHITTVQLAYGTRYNVVQQETDAILANICTAVIRLQKPTILTCYAGPLTSLSPRR